MDNVRMPSVQNVDFSIHDHFTFVVLYFPLEPGPRSEPEGAGGATPGPEWTHNTANIH